MELRFWMDSETGLPHTYDHVPDADRQGAFVVTAFDMSYKVKRAFRKRQRRKRL